MRTRGFTLLEVVIAMAILALSATAILGAGAQALNAHVYAKRISTISWLARSKMTDLEQRLYDKPLNTTDEESNGDFEAEGWPDIKWRARILVPKTTTLDPAQLASVLFGIPVEALSLGPKDGGTPDTPPAARDGGSSSLSALGPLASVAETQGTNVLQQLGRSLREIRLLVSWTDGTQNDSLTLVTHVLSNGPGSDLNRSALNVTPPSTPGATMSAHRQGFTLIEVIVAVTMTAFIGVVLAATFNTSVNTKILLDEESLRVRAIDVALSRLAMEIGAAYVSDRFDTRRFRDFYNRPTNFIGTRDRVQFATFSHERLYVDSKESDQQVVEYALKNGDRGKRSLLRREKVVFDDKMDRGGVEEVLLDDVEKFELAYWDSTKQSWDNEWDTRRPEKKSILPTRVRFAIVTKNAEGKETRYTTQARPILNIEFPRFQ